MQLPNQMKGIESVQSEDLLWMYVESPTRDKMNIIANQFPIHELNIEDCLSKNNLPKNR